MKRCTVTRRGGSIVIACDYDAAWIAAIKLQIPSFARTWDKPSKTWTVSQPYIVPALQLCRAYFEVTLISEDTPESPPAKGQSDWAAALFGAVPSHLHEPLYKALVKVLHPDIGGDLTATQTLTRAYAATSKAA